MAQDIITTVGYNQHEIINNIISLHCPDGIEVDPTYSKGGFYKPDNMVQPLKKFDLIPRTDDTVQSDASNLPLDADSVGSIMFDPPFIVGHTKDKPTGKMGERFHGFRYIHDLWAWYDDCLEEFSRILKPKGVLIFKCQDTVSSHKQWLSHVHIINKAEELGFYTKDMFVLLAKSRAIGHNHAVQQHARKFHSYFLVFIKNK